MLKRLRALWGRETRSLGQDYSTWLTSVAAGTGQPGKAAETAAAMACAFQWASALAASRVEGDQHGAVTPDLLAAVGWRLIVGGQYLARIELDGDSLRLIEPSGYDIEGSPDPKSWRWNLEESGPSLQHTVRGVTNEGLVRIPWALNPAAPWGAVGPLAGSTAKALANVEERLQQEAGALSALVIPTPPATAKTDGQTVDPVAKLGSDLVSAKGKPILVETMASGHGEGRAAAPQGDYVQRRIGFDPPETLDALRQAVEQSVAPPTGATAWGVDLAMGEAMAAIACYWTETGRLDAIAAFSADKSLAERARIDGAGSAYARGAAEGRLIVLGNRTVSVGLLLREALRRWGVPSVLAGDRCRKRELLDAMDAVGLGNVPFVKRGQGYVGGGEDIRDFRMACLEDRVTPVPSVLMRHCLRVARLARPDAAGNDKLARGSENGRKRRARDDAAAAAVLAVAEGSRRRATLGRPTWRSRGVVGPRGLIG